MAGKIRGQQIKDDSITGTDVNESTLVLTHFVQLKYTKTDNNNKIYVRIGANGSNEIPGVNNKFVAPADGVLKYALIRSTSAPGSTVIGLHKASDGTENISTSAVQTQTVDLSTANTVVKATFDSSASFSANDIIGVSVEPTNVHGNVNLALVLELQPF